jgi:putative sterol carrier protein
MTEITTRFFEELDARGHEPLLAKATGVLQFDLTEGDDVETWVLEINRGDVALTRDPVDSACRVRSTRKLFDGIATGHTNAMAAMLRGDIAYDGDTELLMLFQRIFPSPPGAKGPVRPENAGSAQ